MDDVFCVTLPCLNATGTAYKVDVSLVVLVMRGVMLESILNMVKRVLPSLA
jgi:hypothetical protein